MAKNNFRMSSTSPVETGSSGKSSSGAEGRFKGALDSNRSAKSTETPNKYAGALDGGDKAKSPSGSSRYANAFETKPKPSEVKPTPTPAEKPTETKPKGTRPGESSGGSEVKPTSASVEKPKGTKPGESSGGSEVKPTSASVEKPKGTKPGESSGGSEVKPTRPSVEKPSGTKPIETKPGGSEVKPTRPTVEKPTGTKPVETKPGGSEVKPTFASVEKPKGTKPSESSGGSEVKPTSASVEKPKGTKPGESTGGSEVKPTRPSVEKPSGTKPIETKPGGSEVKPTRPTVEKPTGTKPVETKPGGSEVKPTSASVEKPTGTKPIETKPKGSEVKPAHPSVEKPTGTKPIETKPKGSEVKPASASVEKPKGTKPGEGSGESSGEGTGESSGGSEVRRTSASVEKPTGTKSAEKASEAKPVEAKGKATEVGAAIAAAEVGAALADAEVRKKGAELSAEQKELRRREAEEELKMHTFSEETLRSVERDMENRKFRNGEGEEMRYSEAANAMISDVDRTLTRLQTEHGREISEEQRQAMLDDMRRTLLSQQAESEARAIGNHGIPHIYGNYERLKDIPDEVYARAAEQLRERSPGSEATADDIRMGVILACAYHDEGYLSERASTVDPETGRKEDGMHGVDSAIRFEREHAEHFAGAVDAAALDDAVMAIAQHNLLSEGSVERIEAREEDNPARTEMLERIGGAEPANMDPNENFIRSALLLSDKAATDADEKMPDALRSPEAAKVLMDYYALQNSGAEGEDAAALRDQMRGRLAEVLRADESLSEEQRQRLTEALERDVDVRADGGKGSYDFDFPMAGMATPSDAVGFSLGEDGAIEARVTLYTRVEDPLYGGIYEGDSVPAREHKPELMAKKAAGQLEDMGITGATMEGEPKEWLTEVRDESGEAVGFAVETEHIEELSHVSVEIRDVEADNPKAKPSEIGLALEERAEELRDLESECKVQRDAMREARASMDAALASGTLTKAELISYSAQIYDEGNRDQINAIMDRLSALEDPTREELRGIAEQLSRVHVRTYEEILRDRARGK